MSEQHRPRVALAVTPRQLGDLRAMGIDPFALARAHGLTLEVVSDEPIRDGSFLVCPPPPGNVDDVPATCVDCATPVVHRPNGPAAAKVCVECARTRLRGLLP